MKEIMRELKGAVIFQPIGIICAFIAYFIPGSYDAGYKMALFVFGISVICGYWLYLLVKVYLPLKKEEK